MLFKCDKYLLIDVVLNGKYSEIVKNIEKQARAMAMVEAKKAKKEMPKSEYRGEIKIGETTIPCAVLNNGVRILTENGIIQALSSGGASGASKRLKKAKSDEAHVPVFLAADRLKPFIDEGLHGQALKQVEYIDGERIVVGYDAKILPIVCDIWLKARDANVLQSQQMSKAKKAEILMRGLAHVGITALVDEATGYQKDREKDALAKILEAFVAKEIQPYMKTFPSEYYEQLFRLYGYDFPPKDKRPQWRPAFFGGITNEVIYNRIAPDLLPELKKSASKAERKAKLHQWLTSDIGHPKLREHLASIVTLLKLSKTPQEFREKVDLIHPRFGETLPFDFEEKKEK